MSNDRGNRPIRPELIAEKLFRIRNFEHEEIFDEIQNQPRYVEALWFLQWVSNPENYPGGMNRFVIDLLMESDALIGTREMQLIGAIPTLSIEQAKSISAEIPCSHYDLSEKAEAALSELADNPDRWIDYGSWREAVTVETRWKYYFELCKSNAAEDLARYFFDLCEQPHCRFTRPSKVPNGVAGYAPWYFPKVMEAVFSFMDNRKQDVSVLIAETEITHEINRWLGVALRAGRAVMFIGTERFGKSEAIKSYCNQNPGLARLVQTPPSNSEMDLLRAVAKALGIHSDRPMGQQRLRETVEEIITQSRLMLVFDECQFLIPGNYSKTTTPPRLNWFRRTVMDNGIPSALVATPQSYKPSKDRFVKKTGFAVAQFDERILKVINLPPELPRHDLIAIARIHFPRLADPYLDIVVDTTIATERNYVSDIEKIGTLARIYAEQAGRKSPIDLDIDKAIADVLPSISLPTPEKPQEVIQENGPRQTHKRTIAKSMQTRCKSPADPLLNDEAEETTLTRNRVELFAESIA